VSRAGSTAVGTGSAISTYGFGNLGSILMHGASSLGGPAEAANGNSVSDRLWRTDGTASGTVLVKTIPAATGAKFSVDIETPAGAGIMTQFGSKVLFVGQDPNAIWETDGTAAGTHLDVRLTGSGPGNTSMTTVGTHVLFEYVETSISSGAVWTTDGTQDGTSLVLAGANALFVPGGFAQLVVSGPELRSARRKRAERAEIKRIANLRVCPGSCGCPA
jgi:ELWxxDGT repeat protein